MQFMCDAPSFFFTSYGVVAQASMYLTPKWEVFGRFEYGWLDFDIATSTVQRSDLTLLTLGFNHYIDGHDLKWTTDIGIGLSQIEDFWGANSAADYRFDPENTGADPQVVFRTQLQLLF